MNVSRINLLIAVGATDQVRAYLKRLALKERLPALHECIPYVKQSPASLKFFHENFASEIGALVQAGYDCAEAERLYNAAKQMK